MGATKLVEGDNHIVYHVGKELPERGSNFLLVPGMQNAQGRGVYFSEEPQLKYSGGEHYQQQLEVIPIYCIPMIGKWRKGVLKKKDNQVVYHTEGRVVNMKNLQYVEKTTPEGQRLRYYYSLTPTFYSEPKTQIYDEFSSQLRTGRMTTTEAEAVLQHTAAEIIDQEIVRTSLETAVNKGFMPDLDELKKDENLEFSRESEGELALQKRITTPEGYQGYGIENGG